MNVDDLEQDIIKLSRKHNLPPGTIRKIWNYQFQKMMKIMKEEFRVSCKVRGLGTFYFSEAKYNKIIKNTNEPKLHGTETST